MMLKFTVASIEAFYIEQGKKLINKLSNPMLQYAKEISPTDTKEYINSWKRNSAQLEGFVVKGGIENTSEHKRIVETGVQGKKYNYHKGPPRNDGNVIYRGVGNRTGQRTLDNIKKDFINEAKNIGNI